MSLLYESYWPKTEDTIKATFTDHPGMIGTERDPIITTLKVQNATDKFPRWSRKFEKKLSVSKYIHIKSDYKITANLFSTMVNNITVPRTNSAKY